MIGFAGLSHLLLGHESRLAIEVRVGKEPRGRTSVVENVEEELAVIVAHAGPAADDLLELRHRADDAREHDILAGRSIDAGGEQLRSRQDHRRHGFEVLKLAEVPTADAALVGRDAADIVRDTAARDRR